MIKRKFSDRWAIRYPEKPNFIDINWEKYPQFKKNWEFSCNKLEILNQKLNRKFKEDKTFSVLVAGSYGRMDAHEKSDLDFLIIHDDLLQDNSTKIDTIRKLASELLIGLPNSDGAFSKPIHLTSLIESTGSRDDDLTTTAQRLLILMECRPIYNEIFFKTIIDQILDHYLKLVSEEPEKECLVLLNDLIKYFRNICINVEFSFWQKGEEEKWGLRNIKLRHSRVLIYSGLLLLLLNASKYRTKKISYLRDHIKLSPLEKISEVYNDNRDYNFDRVLGAYNNFLHKLVNNDVRDSLASLDYADRFNNSHYAELKTNSSFLQAEQTRFILDNRRNWTSQVFEYLIY